MSKLILVTVGTSALEKCRSVYSNLDSEQLSIQINQKGENSQLYKEVKDNVLGNLRTNTQRYLEGIDSSYSKLSAEIASLLAMHKEPGIGNITNQDKIVLLHSDTVDGKLCAEVNAEVIREKLCSCTSVRKLDGIKVEATKKDEDVLELFLSTGMDKFQEVVTEEKKNFGQPNVYLNITGGYKVLIPFSTILAHNMDLTLVYIYEKSNKLMRLHYNYLKRKICKPTEKLSEGYKEDKPLG